MCLLSPIAFWVMGAELYFVSGSKIFSFANVILLHYFKLLDNNVYLVG